MLNRAAYSNLVYDCIKGIRDPEYPFSLEDLFVIKKEKISLNLSEQTIKVEFEPTIPHCNNASLIGLMIKTKLIRSFPQRFKVERFACQENHR